MTLSEAFEVRMGSPPSVLLEAQVRGIVSSCRDTGRGLGLLVDMLKTDVRGYRNVMIEDEWITVEAMVGGELVEARVALKKQPRR